MDRPLTAVERARQKCHEIAGDVEYDYTPQAMAQALRELEDAIHQEHEAFIHVANYRIRSAIKRMAFAWANYAGIDSAWVMQNHGWMEAYAEKEYPLNDGQVRDADSYTGPWRP